MSSAPGPIRIFRPGTFKSVEGVEVSFGAVDLQEIADAYDVTSDPAPMVIGHPQVEDPAYGWISHLTVDSSGELLAHPEKVEPSFAETVRAGQYAKVSAQFYPPDHAHNPKPGRWYLKHVGFLGAHAPGVKGLGTVSLAAGDAGALVTIVNQETKMSDNQGDKPNGEDLASFAEREDALKQREDAVAKREKDAAAAAAKARHDDHVSFAEGMVSTAKLAPKDKDLLVGLLDQLGDAGGVVSFGEAEADKLEPVAALKKLLGGAQPLVSLGEFAGKEKGGGAKLASFAAPPGYQVDPEQAALYARAKDLQASNPSLGWMDAVRQAGV